MPYDYNYNVEITDVTTNPASGLIVVGETFEIQCTIHNNEVFEIRLSTLTVRRVSGENPAAFIYFFAPTAAHALPVIAPGASGTFNLTCTMAAPVSLTERTFVPYLSLQYYYVPVGGVTQTLAEIEYGQLTGITALDMRYVPRIESFEAARYPADEDAQARVVLRCALAEGANPNSDGLYIDVQWREEGAEVFAEEDRASVSVAQALTAAGAATVLPSAFDRGKAYVLRATFGDGFDSAFAQARLSKSFANLHLAGSGAGVAVGQYSTGTQAQPLFECAYPARFYGGIEGVTNYAPGETATGGRWIDGRPIYRQTLMFPPLAWGGTAYASLGYAVSEIDAVISARGFSLGASSGFIKIIPSPDPQPALYTVLCDLDVNDLDDLRVRVATGSYMALPKGFFVIVEYTKAADAPTYYRLPYLTANTDAGCTITASSEFDTNFQRVYAFMGPMYSRYWATTVADTERWIQVEMPYKLTNMIVTLMNPAHANPVPAADQPVAGTFLGSDDASAWTQLGTFADRPTTEGAATRHELNNATGYKYLRVQVTQPGAGVWTGFADVRVEGEVEA